MEALGPDVPLLHRLANFLGDALICLDDLLGRGLVESLFDFLARIANDAGLGLGLLPVIDPGGNLAHQRIKWPAELRLQAIERVLVELRAGTGRAEVLDAVFVEAN